MISDHCMELNGINLVVDITLNNKLCISWWSVLLIGWGLGKKTTDLPKVNDYFLSHKVNCVQCTVPPVREIQAHPFSGDYISTDCIIRCRYEYHAIAATTNPSMIYSYCSHSDNIGNIWLIILYLHFDFQHQVTSLIY